MQRQRRSLPPVAAELLEEQSADDLACAGPSILAILAIASGAPDLLVVFLPPAVCAARLMTSSSQSSSKSVNSSLCCFSTIARNASQGGGVDLGVVALSPKVLGL
jgi:hypothetical protein